MKNYYVKWKSITNDSFFLNCIKGHEIKFNFSVQQVKPPTEPLRSSDENKAITKALSDYINIGAIEPCNSTKGQFLSSYFLIRKPDGTVFSFSI